MLDCEIIDYFMVDPLNYQISYVNICTLHEPQLYNGYLCVVFKQIILRVSEGDKNETILLDCLFLLILYIFIQRENNFVTYTFA